MHSYAMERVNRSKPTLHANFYLISKQRHSSYVEFTDGKPLCPTLTQLHHQQKNPRRWLTAEALFLFNLQALYVNENLRASFVTTYMHRAGKRL